MSKIKKLSKEIPDPTHDFQVNVEGAVTKKKFYGDFQCKIPRRKEQCLIDKHRAFLNGEVADRLEASTLNFHHMISYLRYTLTETPKWWKDSDLGYDLYDENVVREIYDQVLSFEVEWLKEVWGEEAVGKLQSRQESRDGKVEEENEKEGD